MASCLSYPVAQKPVVTNSPYVQGKKTVYFSRLLACPNELLFNNCLPRMTRNLRVGKAIWRALNRAAMKWIGTSAFGRMCQ